MSELNAMDIKNRERFFYESYQKDIKVYDLSGKKAIVKLDDIKEYDIMNLRNEYDIITIPSTYIDDMWVYLICPVCDEKCYGIISGGNKDDVTSLIYSPRLWSSKFDERPIEEYGPKIVNMRELIMQYKIWKESRGYK